jgi:hypothetical protein
VGEVLGFREGDALTGPSVGVVDVGPEDGGSNVGAEDGTAVGPKEIVGCEVIVGAAVVGLCVPPPPRNPALMYTRISLSTGCRVDGAASNVPCKVACTISPACIELLIWAVTSTLPAVAHMVSGACSDDVAHG